MTKNLTHSCCDVGRHQSRYLSSASRVWNTPEAPKVGRFSTRQPTLTYRQVNVCWCWAIQWANLVKKSCARVFWATLLNKSFYWMRSNDSVHLRWPFLFWDSSDLKTSFLRDMSGWTSELRLQSLLPVPAGVAGKRMWSISAPAHESLLETNRGAVPERQSRSPRPRTSSATWMTQTHRLTRSPAVWGGSGEMKLTAALHRKDDAAIEHLCGRGRRG